MIMIQSSLISKSQSYIYVFFCLLIVVSLLLTQTTWAMTYQKWSQENTLVYPLTQNQIDNLSSNTLTQWFTMQDDRVRISSDRLNQNKWPQIWSNRFIAEMLTTATAVDLAKNNISFQNSSINRDLYQVSWLDPEQPYISDVLSKYDIDSVDELADFVHLDRPTQALDDALEWLTKRWTPRQPWLLLENSFGKLFTETIVCDESMVAAMVMQTSYSAFAAKYYYGFARPEEIMSAYIQWDFQIDHTDAEAYLNKLLDVSIGTQPEAFTMYPEWSPTHPSRPAMHSSVASVLYLLDILYDLNDYERDQILRLQSNIAFGRTFAWVHRPYDNIIGINMGIEIASAWLIKELIQNSWITYNEAVLEDLIQEKKSYVSYAF